MPQGGAKYKEKKKAADYTDYAQLGLENRSPEVAIKRDNLNG